jgi:hypothetical protein
MLSRLISSHLISSLYIITLYLLLVIQEIIVSAFKKDLNCTVDTFKGTLNLG